MSRTGVFVVTGCASGIGLAITKKIAAQGHIVYGLGRDQDKLLAAEKVVGPEFLHSKSVDLTLAQGSIAAAMEVVEFLSTRKLPLLGLVNNAGIFIRRAFIETTDEVWEQQFAGNLLSAVRLTRLLYPHLRNGSVLNISSSLGQRPIAETSAYSAAKAALINFTQSLALEAANDAIRVNCLCPGIVDTPIHGFRSADDPARKLAHAAQPLKRMGTPEEIAEAAWFLLSPLSAWTTGATLTVDGGISL